MKYILYIILIIIGWLALSKLTNYEERMNKYNRYMCAMYGYYEDCKTPLQDKDKLK